MKGRRRSDAAIATSESYPRRPLESKRGAMTPEQERENREIFDRIGVDLPRAHTVLDIARSAGADLWFSEPGKLEIDLPRSLPPRLRKNLFLHLFLNHRALGQILEAEWDALAASEAVP
jgi:hypothetical protein